MIFLATIQALTLKRTERRGISKTLVLIFPELVLKSLPERGDGAQIGEIRVYVMLTLQIVKVNQSVQSPFPACVRQGGTLHNQYK